MSTCPHRGAVVGVVSGLEHVGCVERERNVSALGALANGVQLRSVGREHEHRLDEQRQVLAAVRIEVVLADRRRAGAGGDPAHEKRRHVESLPGGEVVAHDHGNLGVEVGHGHAARMLDGAV